MLEGEQTFRGSLFKIIYRFYTDNNQKPILNVGTIYEIR